MKLVISWRREWEANRRKRLREKDDDDDIDDNDEEEEELKNKIDAKNEGRKHVFKLFIEFEAKERPTYGRYHLSQT